jgi:hypothetical protein
MRYAVIPHAIEAVAMVRMSFGWVETGGRKCAAVVVAAKANSAARKARPSSANSR